MLQTTSLNRSNNGPTSMPYVYQGQVRDLQLDGKLEDIVCQRLDSCKDTQLIRDASALKALYISQAGQVDAARKEADENRHADVKLDLGQGPQDFEVTKMPSGDYRFINSDDPGYDIRAQVILMQGGEHAHYTTLSTRVPGSEGEPDLLQTVKMSFTKSQNFLVDSEELQVGDLRRLAVAPHIPAWDFQPQYATRPFAD